MRLEHVILLDRTHGSRFHRRIDRVVAAGDDSRLERSVGPGEIAVFRRTGRTAAVPVTDETRGGPVTRTVMAAVCDRVGTRLLA